jgi:hypothetical protein
MTRYTTDFLYTVTFYFSPIIVFLYIMMDKQSTVLKIHILKFCKSIYMHILISTE